MQALPGGPPGASSLQGPPSPSSPEDPVGPLQGKGHTAAGVGGTSFVRGPLEPEARVTEGGGAPAFSVHSLLDEFYDSLEADLEALPPLQQQQPRPSRWGPLDTPEYRQQLQGQLQQLRLANKQQQQQQQQQGNVGVDGMEVLLLQGAGRRGPSWAFLHGLPVVGKGPPGAPSFKVAAATLTALKMGRGALPDFAAAAAVLLRRRRNAAAAAAARQQGRASRGRRGRRGAPLLAQRRASGAVGSRGLRGPPEAAEAADAALAAEGAPLTRRSSKRPREEELEQAAAAAADAGADAGGEDEVELTGAEAAACLARLETALGTPISEAPSESPWGPPRLLLQCCVCGAYFSKTEQLHSHVGPPPLFSEGRLGRLGGPLRASFRGPPQQRSVAGAPWGPYRGAAAWGPAARQAEARRWLSVQWTQGYQGFSGGGRRHVSPSSVFMIASQPPCRAREMLRHYGVYFNRHLMKAKLGPLPEALMAEHAEAEGPLEVYVEDYFVDGKPNRSSSSSESRGCGVRVVGWLLPQELARMFPEFEVTCLSSWTKARVLKGDYETPLHAEHTLQHQVTDYDPSARGGPQAGEGVWGALRVRPGSTAIFLETTPHACFRGPRKGLRMSCDFRWALSARSSSLGRELSLPRAVDDPAISGCLLCQVTRKERAAQWMAPTATWLFSPTGAAAQIGAAEVSVHLVHHHHHHHHHHHSSSSRLRVVVRSFGLPPPDGDGQNGGPSLVHRQLSWAPRALWVSATGGPPSRVNCCSLATRRACKRRGFNISLSRSHLRAPQPQEENEVIGKGAPPLGAPPGAPRAEQGGTGMLCLKQEEKEERQKIQEALTANWRRRLGPLCFYIEAPAEAAAERPYAVALEAAAAEEAAVRASRKRSIFAHVYEGGLCMQTHLLLLQQQQLGRHLNVARNRLKALAAAAAQARAAAASSEGGLPLGPPTMYSRSSSGEAAAAAEAARQPQSSSKSAVQEAHSKHQEQMQLEQMQQQQVQQQQMQQQGLGSGEANLAGGDVSPSSTPLAAAGAAAATAAANAAAAAAAASGAAPGAAAVEGSSKAELGIKLSVSRGSLRSPQGAPFLSCDRRSTLRTGPRVGAPGALREIDELLRPTALGLSLAGASSVPLSVASSKQNRTPYEHHALLVGAFCLSFSSLYASRGAPPLAGLGPHAEGPQASQLIPQQTEGSSLAELYMQGPPEGLNGQGGPPFMGPLNDATAADLLIGRGALALVRRKEAEGAPLLQKEGNATCSRRGHRRSSSNTSSSSSSSNIGGFLSCLMHAVSDAAAIAAARPLLPAIDAEALAKVVPCSASLGRHKRRKKGPPKDKVMGGPPPSSPCADAALGRVPTKGPPAEAPVVLRSGRRSVLPPTYDA
ncbi:hypothetical protein Efla_004497 [Eimeria flavescens]